MFTAQWFKLGGGVVHPLMRRYKHSQVSLQEGQVLSQSDPNE
ncbi:hypothetical protein D051_4029 [Vibrio parahaemolyticus VPCR-2010]|nr:hypothetical protein D051_4029 [Vibrio parahaemolyticus VPCR-2010]